MRYFRRVEGSEVFLSPMNPEDTDIYTKWLNHTEVRLLLGIEGNISQCSQRDVLEKMARAEHNFSIVRQSDERLLGSCSLKGVNHQHRNAWLGMFIGDDEMMSHGYGSQALALLLKYAFDEVNLCNVSLNVYAYNQRAIHVYEKVGFRLIGRRRESHIVQGRAYDEIQMDILPHELNRALIGREG